MTDILILIAGYLFGSFSSAVVVSKILRLPDPRTQGSKNPGATNMLRLGGKKAALITLLGDMLKGLIPVLLAKMLGASEWIIALTGLLAFIGHCFPVFFGFIGGKGVATAIGVLFGINIWVGLWFVAVWLLCAVLTRYSSLSALIAITISPITTLFITNRVSYTLVVAAIAALIYWRHKENIERLKNGTEGKIGQKKTSEHPPEMS